MPAEGARGLVQFVIEDQGVERDVALDAAAVQGAHDFGQLGQVEADLGAGGEVLEPEVHGVGAGFDGGVELRPVTGGTHDFRLTEGVHPGLLSTSGYHHRRVGLWRARVYSNCGGHTLIWCDKQADLAGPGIGNYEDLEAILPANYSSLLTLKETQKAIFAAKTFIENASASR